MPRVPSDTGRLSRRSFLATAASGATVAASGCADRLPSVINPIDNTLTLSISALPADADREGVQIARMLKENLEAVGMAASVDMRPRSEYLRQVLLDHDFDLYVGQLTDITDPDVLFGALYSRFAAESGWQNPFGFASRTFDRLLERQRETEGSERAAAVADLCEATAAELPFVAICRPDEYRVVRHDRITGWSAEHLGDRRGYLGLEVDEGATELGALVTGVGPTQTVNPFAALHRNRGTVMSLVYDSLGVVTAGDVEPWLAEGWTRDGDTISLTLREDLTFHDGAELTAEDVAFTYRFLEDTSLGFASVPAEPPRYRRHATTVENVEYVDDRTVRLTVAAAPPVAERALTVPILPAHIWRSHIESVADADGAFRQGRYPLVSDGADIEPIGSGPYAHAGSVDREYLELERFPDHFSLRPSVDLPGPTVAELTIGIDPSSLTAINQVEMGAADVTMSPLDTYAIDRAQRIDGTTVEAVGGTGDSVYIVGFNVRSSPLSTPSVRHAIGGLLDKDWLVSTVFEGHARPVASPLSADWTPPSLAYGDGDPVTPFLGEDGDLDVEEARERLMRAGLEYDGGFVDPGH